MHTVVVSLPTLDVLRQATTGPAGLLSGSAPKTVVNTCTVGSPFITEIAQARAAAGAMLIDAPISGGRTGAQAATDCRHGLRQSDKNRGTDRRSSVFGGRPW